MRRPRRRTNYISRSIESFSDEDCWKLFRTRKTDLYRLRRALKLDQDVFIADNGTKFTGDEILLIGLHTYCISGPIDQTTSFRFSLELSQLSRAFNNLSYWVDLFPYFAECISKRLADSCDIHYPAGSFRVFGFHDDTVIATCPPPNGERHDNYIQMAFYNGWKRHHGYKYQTLELPNGMCADMYGPTSFIHHDLELLRDSKLNEKLADIQLGRIHQYVSYGDGIFPIDSHTIGKHIGNTTKEERYENRMMSKIRIANEWDYGSTADLFPFIKWRAAQKTRRNDSAKEDDGEFNEDYENNFEEILTEEARLAILSEFQRQNDNNNDEDEEEVDDEVDDDIEINDEVDTAAEPETENDNDSHVDSAENIKNVDDYNDKNADENLESNYDIEENIVNDIQPTKNIQRNKFVISDDNHEMTDTNIITNIVTNSDITNDDDTQLMDDNDNEIVVTMESVNEESKPKTVKDPMMKNALYRLQLLEEERRNKKEKSRNNSLLELEAEEEEEEGQQAGLGDFGFTFTKKDELDEIDALKLRKGDLDHIVDDVSDDEGDEEAGLKARLEQQEKEEKAKTRAIITAITEGHDTAKRLRNNKNIMSFNQLVGDDDEQIVNKIYDQENNNTTNDDDLDEEELLLRGLENRKNRDEQMKLYRSEFDEYDEEDEEEEEYMNTQDLENMTEEEKLIEYNKQKLRLEKKRISNLKRKQFEDLCKMRRALRRAQSLTQNDNQPLSSYLPAPSIVLTLDENQYNNDSYEETANSQNKSIKRRTFQQPKQFDKSNNKLLQRSNTVSTLQPLSDRTIDEAEILGGYGMGMAVTASNTRRNNIANKPTVGLFAAATDIR
eukprot:gene18566-24289_t